MQNNENSTKLCKYCRTEIPKDASVCPNCKRKQTSLIIRLCKVVAIFCIAVMILSYCSNVKSVHEKNDKNKNPVKVSSSENASNNENPISNRFNVGDVLETKDFRISYISSQQYVSYNEFIQPKDGYVYWRFEFKFENISDTDKTVSSMADWECYADNVKVDQTWIGDENGLDAFLSSGRTTQGAVYFEVPVNASNIELEYDINCWESDKIIFAGK